MCACVCLSVCLSVCACVINYNDLISLLNTIYTPPIQSNPQPNQTKSEPILFAKKRTNNLSLESVSNQKQFVVCVFPLSLYLTLSLLLCLSPFSRRSHMYVCICVTHTPVCHATHKIFVIMPINWCVYRMQISVSVSLFYSYCVKHSLPFSLSLSVCLSHTHSLSLIRSLDWSQSIIKCYVYICLALSISLVLSLALLSVSLTLYALSLTCHYSQRVLSQCVLREGVTMRSIVDFSAAYCAQCASFHFWQWGDLKSLQNWGQSAAHTHRQRETLTNTQSHTYTHTHTRLETKWKISAKSKS